VAHRVRQLVLVSANGELICHTPIQSVNGEDPLVEARQELFSLLLEQTGMKIIEVNRIVKGKLS
jgi:hypothetical protein